MLVFVPFLIPVPPAPGTSSPHVFADRESSFVQIGNVEVHYKKRGTGTTALLLLHGFGASTFTWHKVMEPLSQRYTVVAHDRTGFGLSSRPLPGEWDGESPYSPESHAAQTIALMDSLGIDKAVLAGSSAGGVVALLTAVRYPERVRALILVGPALYRGGPPSWLPPLLHVPPVKRVGPLLLRSYFASLSEKSQRAAWYDQSKLLPDTVEEYKKPLRVSHWDRGLWEFALAYRVADLEDELSGLNLPVLVLSGDEDRIVPEAYSRKLAGKLPRAAFVTIPRCGHLPHEESPERFVEEVIAFLETVL